jgi:hypothetical protein
VNDTGNIVVPGTAHFNMTAYAFDMWAHQFYECRLMLQPSEGVSPVPYFLACRAIELKLKSIHLEQSNEQEVKRRFKHDLVKSYKALPQAFQPLSSTELDLLGKANDVYSKKEFEYFLNVRTA